ncbi:MAG: carbohydrate ABC transporter substrate-binding protein, partial [Actinomycetia bacterium]|nr:carbohydrate ABC transporter substrate-binding protein [Actinomycetes bacterium]
TGDDDTSGDTTDDDDGGGDGAESLLDGEIPCDQQYDGKTVTIFSPVRNSDTDQAIGDYVDGYQPLIDCTGVEIEWEGTDQFETEINVRLEGGNPPDVIDYPQPGLLTGHVQKGFIYELPADVAAHTTNDFIPGWDTYASVDGKIYGIPGRSSIKSIVWYSPSLMEDGGYEIPQTLEELTALSDQIVTDGGTPWCVGAESGVATGWVLTDWIEDFMLRINGGDVYDQWTNHEIPFNDPQVVAAVDAVGAFVKNPDYLGGDTMVKAIATTKFQDGGLPILTGDCYMHRQASFLSGSFPEGTTFAPDGDMWFFYLPSPADGPKFVLGAGDVYAAATDKPESFDVLRYTGGVAYQTHIVNARKELSPNLSLDLDAVDDPFVRAVIELQNSADVFRFDGSDLMPGAVGAGTFWTEVTAWVIGGDTEDFVNNVEDSWPDS